MNHLSFQSRASVEIVRPRLLLPKASLSLKGLFRVQHYRGDELLAELFAHNNVNTEGVNYMFNVAFYGQTQIAATNWYLGLVNNVSPTPSPANTDTYAGIAESSPTNGWAELASYTDTNNGASAATRPVWPMGSASNRTITNSSSTAIYAMTAACTVWGLFACGGTGNTNQKGNNNSGGVCYATAAFSSPVSCQSGDTLKVTYSISA